MALFYVFQGTTYNEESKGGYVWSPQLDKAGHRNSGFSKMLDVKKGDFILHNNLGKVVAISIAETDCFEADKPDEVDKSKASDKWNQDGYRINTKYYEFDHALQTKPLQNWLKEHHVEGSAFTTAGKGKQQYMCDLAENHAIHILEKAIAIQSDENVLKYLKNALSEIVGEKESEYSLVELDIINETVEEDNEAKPEWSGRREVQEMTASTQTGRDIPKRDPRRAADALHHADYRCEYNPNDRTFVRKNGKPYTEPHHLIPISKYRDFDYSVDIMENIVSLCSHCHNLLHYGQFEDKQPILQKHYNERIKALEACGITLTLEQLESYYK